MAVKINGSTGITFEDNDKQNWGTGNDLALFHDGTHSYIDSNTGSLKIQSGGGAYIEATEFKIYDEASSETVAEFITDGACKFYHDNVNKFETFSSGVKINGNLVGVDNKKIQLGNDNDLQIYHDGSHSKIQNSTGALLIDSDNLQLRDKTNTKIYLHGEASGKVELRYDNNT